MAFRFSVNTRSPDSCGLAIVTGTYTNASGDTGGVINTTLKECIYFDANCMTSQAADMNYSVRDAGLVTLTTVDDEDGQWLAIGY